jgi:hypothetical protein
VTVDVVDVSSADGVHLTPTLTLQHDFLSFRSKVDGDSNRHATRCARTFNM